MENILIKITQKLSKLYRFTMRITSDNQYGVITEGYIMIMFEVAKYPVLMQVSENYIKPSVDSWPFSFNRTAEDLIKQFNHHRNNCNDSIDVNFKKVFKALSNPAVKHFAYYINITHNLCVRIIDLKPLAPLLKMHNNIKCYFYNDGSYSSAPYPFCFEIDGLKILIVANLVNDPQYNLQTSSINLAHMDCLQLYDYCDNVIYGYQIDESKYLFYNRSAEAVAKILNKKTIEISFKNQSNKYSTIIIKENNYQTLQSKCCELQIPINIK